MTTRTRTASWRGVRPGRSAPASVRRRWTASPVAGGCPSTRSCSPRPRLLRRRGDGDQGAGLDGPGLRAARVLLPRDRPQQAGGRPLPRPRRRLRRRHRRGARGPADHAVGPRLGARGGGRGPGQRAATSSTPCARSSPRCTTRSRSGPARATGSSTSATRATRRRSARWPSPPTPSTGSSRSPRSTPCPDLDEPVALLAQTTLSHRDWAGVADAGRRAVPRPVDAGPQRPVLRHHQPPVGAGRDRPPLRRRRRDRLGQLVQHPGAREAGPRGRLRPGLPGQPRRRAARRPGRHRRRHRRRLGARGAGRGGDRPPGPADGVEEVRITDEDEYFPPPRKLRDLLTGVDVLATFGLGGSVPDRPRPRRPRPRRQRRPRCSTA